MEAAKRSAVEMIPKTTEGSDGYLQMTTPLPEMTSPAAGCKYPTTKTQRFMNVLRNSMSFFSK